ncbi:MAG TPA: type II toxin-antitoxin system VapC family toxin [Micromonosporaceae bacterium]
MIVDSSAVLAILLKEPGWEPLLEHIADEDGMPGIGAPTLVESGIVLAARLGATGKSLLARFVQEIGMREIVFTSAHWPAAIDAFLRYGKGRHPAALNFGECLTYATAVVAREPLLCIGDDFAQTDLPLVPVD